MEAKSITVLVVEDEPLVRTMAAEIFADAGYRVCEACDALGALSILAARNDICAVLTDIEMPGGMNGVALAAAIREQWPDMAILVTSGRVFPSEADLPQGVGFRAKPWRINEIVGSMAAML